MPERNSPIYAFFSQQKHDAQGGLYTDEFRDPTGATFQANYTGYEIDGYPGYIEDGKIVRPPNYETYVRVREVGPGKLQPVSRELADSFHRPVRTGLSFLPSSRHPRSFDNDA
jgi:hypothetical protein